jgi:phosphoribosyl 1,2-cyclic phosphodiesterase
MKVNLWGTRGSLASPGPDTVRYGGNTSCVSIEGPDGSVLVLDAGTGIRNLGQNLPPDLKRVDVLLTHLHMDHLQGLPFFAPIRNPDVETHIWGPASTMMDLKSRLLRYVSPPLFPVSMRDLSPAIHFHELSFDMFEIGQFCIISQLVIHPNPTVGYRITIKGQTVTYLPDHEPMLGTRTFPRSPEWTSGFDLAKGADLLIHDTQYTPEEYEARIGFGHSNMIQAFEFAELANVKHFVPFHHDPAHSDDLLDQMITDAVQEVAPDFEVTPGLEGLSMRLSEDAPYEGIGFRSE